jgi:DNA-binding NarL/FixJ family response regulator
MARLKSAVKISVLCVDDHRVVLEGLRLIISREADMVVVGTAASGEEAVELYRRHRPDVTLMDLKLAGLSGLQAIREIRRHHSEARIIVLTMYQVDEDIRKALEAGARTYLLKQTVSADLVRMVREVHAGERPVIPTVQALLDEHTLRAGLSQREVQVVELISQGMRNREIAATLGISEETVHAHVRHVLAKLGASDRSAAVSIALKRGIIHID